MASAVFFLDLKGKVGRIYDDSQIHFGIFVLLTRMKDPSGSQLQG